jgi:hypothetical protein
MKTLLLALFVLVIAPTSLTAQGGEHLRLVVQQNGKSLVNEQRSLSLPKNAGQVVLPNLPTSLEVQTLQVCSQSAPESLKILDLAFDGELLTPSSLLRRYVGKQVTLILPDGKTRDGRIQREATVLSTEEAPLYLVEGRVYSGPVEAIIYPELPEGLASRPSLSLNVMNSGPAKQTLELTYLANEIAWRMDYVLTMNKAATSALLSGWATISNRSGRDFNNADIELLAGEPRSERRPMLGRAYAADTMMMAKAEYAANSEEELFEYHLYRLKKPLSIANQQSRQTQLLESATIPISRKLIGRSNALPSGREADPLKQKLDVVISFRNTSALGLGSPLPGGTVRAFQEQGKARHFLGEAPLERTAVGSLVELGLGKAFDVNVERVVTDFEKTGKNSFRAAWELRITNAKKNAQKIVLQEQIPGKWKIESTSGKWTKASANVLEFQVDVPPSEDGKPLVLKYAFTTEM